MKRMTWNDALVGLTLVHLGQQLGSESKVARAVFDLCNAIVVLLGQVS